MSSFNCCGLFHARNKKLPCNCSGSSLPAANNSLLHLIAAVCALPAAIVFSKTRHMLTLKHKPTKLLSLFTYTTVALLHSLTTETFGFLVHHNLFDYCLQSFFFIIFLFLFFFDHHSCSSYCFSSSSTSSNCAVDIVVALLKPTKTHEIWT